MANDWERVRLGDLVRIAHGWPFKSELYSEELTGRPIVVSIGNFNYTGGFRFDSTTVKEYRGDYPSEFNLSPGAILLVMTCQTSGGEILGIPARIPDDDRQYLHNQRLGKVIVSDRDVDPDFLYYLFLSPQFNRELVSTASGTKILHTAPSRIEAFEFLLPTPAEQRHIGHILRTLDNRIELNRKMNDTLETIARTLFKSWFVDFDPVRAKAERRDPGLPDHIAALFPESIQDSEVGEIPKGWQVKRLAQVCENIFSGGTPSTTVQDYWDGEIPWLSSGETREKFIIATEKQITKRGVEGSSTRLARAGATVIASAGQGNTRGQTSMLMFDSYINQSVVALLPDQKQLTDIHLFFDLERRYEEFRRVSDGHSSRGSLTTKLLGGLSVVTPPYQIAKAFDSVAEPIVMRIASALRESRSLAATRDALLPKLISGEIRLKQTGTTDCQLEEAANECCAKA
jgi:type I restriction enzyme S subunit